MRQRQAHPRQADMTTFQPFRCGECGARVEMLPACGEKREFRRGIVMRIPKGTPIPKCSGCGEVYFSPADEERVDAILEKLWLEHQAEEYADHVATLKRRHGVTLREIERACAVTPTYFSHVMKGRRFASATLTRLLEAFVACPSEFLRHTRGRASSEVFLRARTPPPAFGSKGVAHWAATNEIAVEIVDDCRDVA
jgi:hypothetical protein